MPTVKQAGKLPDAGEVGTMETLSRKTEINFSDEPRTLDGTSASGGECTEANNSTNSPSSGQRV
jgi:hypothetical protein